MKGFDERWRDLPDYILGITHEIWEQRGLATLHDYYAKDLPMRFPSGLLVGNQAVIDGTLATLAEFPDRQLLGEDVIWSGDEEQGFLSSHRLITTGTHLGHGLFGKPTGKRFEARAIADCAVKDNVIYDEWLVRDTSAIVKQLGMKPKRFTRKLIQREGGPKHCTKPFTPEQDVDGGYQTQGNENEWGQRLADILSSMMCKDFSVIRREYDRACRIEHPGGAGGWSWDFVDQVWMQLRSAFPTATFSIDHQIGRSDPHQLHRAAVRWSLSGKHSGAGNFGRPSGAEVYIMGFTHAEFGPWGLKREYTLFDEISVWKQILLHRGDGA
ncbi:MAG: ester cyclase [Thiolinea sp.]